MIIAFEKQWKSQLSKGKSKHNKNEKGKLRTYDKFKTEFQCEGYLNSNLDLETRSYFTKLRLSNHILAIEKGRYTRTSKDKRYCKFCKNESIEDEMHFVLNCKLYRSKILTLFKTIQN